MSLQKYAEILNRETGVAKREALIGVHSMLGCNTMISAEISTEGLKVIVPRLLEATYDSDPFIVRIAIQALGSASVNTSLFDKTIGDRLKELETSMNSWIQDDKDSIQPVLVRSLEDLSLPCRSRYIPTSVF